MALGARAFSGCQAGARSRRLQGTFRVAKPSGQGAARSVARRSTQARSRTQVAPKAFFNFFGGGSAPSGSAKAAELVEELVDIVSSSRPSEDEVAAVVKQLQPLGTKNPVRSKLLFGEYKLIYSSKPIPGSPKQILEEPDVISEVSSTTSLGFLPSTSVQSGELNGIDGNTYEEIYDRVEVKGPLGGGAKPVDIVRKVTVLYLDSDLRIVRVQSEGQADVLAVYQRAGSESVGAGAEEEEGRKSPSLPFFGGGAKEGIATISEREVLKKMAAQEAKGKAGPRLPANLPASPAGAVAARGGTARVVAKPAAGTTVKGAGGTVKVERPSAADAAKARAKEAELRAKEQAAAKEKAEAERRAQQERQAAIRSLVDELSADLKEAQDETRQAAKAAKDVERSSAATLKQVAGARVQLKGAAENVEEAEMQLAKAAQARAAAEAALKQALADVAAAQNKVKTASK